MPVERIDELADLLTRISRASVSTKRVIYSALAKELTNPTKSRKPYERRHKKYQRYPEDIKRKALEMRAEGATLSEIARKTGIKRNSVYTVISEFKEKISAP